MKKKMDKVKIMLIKKQIRRTRKQMKIAKRMGDLAAVDQYTKILASDRREEERKRNQKSKRMIVDSAIQVLKLKNQIIATKKLKITKKKKLARMIPIVQAYKKAKLFKTKMVKYGMKMDVKISKKKIKLAKKQLRKAMRSKKDNKIELAEIFLEKCEKQMVKAKKGRGPSRTTKKQIQRASDSDVEDDDDAGKPKLSKKKKQTLLQKMSMKRVRSKDGTADDDDDEIDESEDEEGKGVQPETEKDKLGKLKEKENK